MNSVRPVMSTRLNAPGDIDDMDENMVSKISKPLSSTPLLDIELSRHEEKRGSFRSYRLWESPLNVDDILESNGLALVRSGGD